MSIWLELEALSEDYAVARLPVDRPLPNWVGGGGVVSITYAGDEVSVVCPAARIPDTVQQSGGWTAIKVTTKFNFDEAGVVLSVVRPISEAGLGVFVVSTYLRDYVLVRTVELDRAKQLLTEAGHSFVAQSLELTVRPAVVSDLEEIVDFHVQTWRKTYQDVAPQRAMKALDQQARRPSWQSALRASADIRQTYVATSLGAIVGLVSFGASEDTAFGGKAEIKHLYVDPEFQRSGIGKRLMSLALERLAEAGHTEAALSVVVENQAARDFYAAIGGREIGAYVDPGPLWKSEGVLVAWDLDGRDQDASVEVAQDSCL